MATRTPVKATNKAPSNKAANFHKGEPIKYTPEMRAELQRRVAAAEEAGKSTSAVYERLAAAWTKKYGREYTENQVSSQFYFAKSKLKAQRKRRAAAAARTRAANRAAAVTSTTTRDVALAPPVDEAMALPGPLADLYQLMKDMQEQLEATKADAAVQAGKAAAAEEALQQVRKALNA